MSDRRRFRHPYGFHAGPAVSQSPVYQHGQVVVAAGKLSQRPNDQVLTPRSGHDIPSAINFPGYRRGHGLLSDLEGLGDEVLTAGSYRTEPAGWPARSTH
jgi:hypothetical protein